MGDCPICFQDCHLRGRGAQRVELLSCSHVFHRCCIMSFESFHVFEVHICPVCRQSYDRRPLHVAAMPVCEPTQDHLKSSEASLSADTKKASVPRSELRSFGTRSRPPLVPGRRAVRSSNSHTN